MPDLQTCRICGDSNYERKGHKYGLVRYSVRSSVHYDCGLKRWGVEFFAKLRLDQLRQFPFMAAIEVGLMDQLKAAAYPDGEPCHANCADGKHVKGCPFIAALKVPSAPLSPDESDQISQAIAREDAARDTTLPPEITPDPETPFDTPQENL